MISFDNTAYAFEYKTDEELKKARFLFSTMGNAALLKTGLTLMPFAFKYKIPFTNFIVRHTIFKQFVGGETLFETAKVAGKLQQYKVQVILDYGVEGGDDGETGFDHATEEFIKVINYAATQTNIPFMSIKITGISRFSLLEKLDTMMHEKQGTLMKKYAATIDSLNETERNEWQRVVNRLLKICDTAFEKNVGVLIDAEESWIQDPVDALTMLMMDKLNRTKAVIFNTIQLYRHDRLAFLKDSYTAANERAFILGAKLVRGAYMEKERNRAAALQYPSPIQPDKKSCDDDYDAAVEFSITHLDKISLIVASHNEKSNLTATELMQRHELPLTHPHLHFSQLYGMSDNITFNLAKAGCSVSKYLPFGPIKDVIPYLMRRAQENSSVAGQTGRELSLIKKELERRSSKD